MRLVMTIGVTAAVLLMAGSARAANRYAAPGGTGPQASCLQENPCSIVDAVEGPAAQDADRVLLAPGTYALSQTLDVTRQLTILPADPAAARPLITSSAGGFAVDVSTSQVGLGGVEIRGSNYGLHLGGGIYGQLVVSAAVTACYLEDANPTGAVTVWLNDSTCLSTAGGSGVAAFSEDDGDSVSAMLTNVTAVSPDLGFTQYGIYAQAGGASATIDLIGTNVIAYGGTDDIRAVINNTATTSAISLDHSNFDAASAAGGGLVTAPGSTNGNQMAPPHFVNLTGLDFHEASGSPTIDAGDANAFLLSDSDVDGDPRQVGTAPDIGSDEYVPVVVPPPDTRAPETTLTNAPRKKVVSRKRRKRASFAFVSDEAGSTFACTLNGQPQSCDGGGFSARVGRGKHSFEVAATDAAGNTDPSPATYSWKLKRKK
jgi:hypothetical protein